MVPNAALCAIRAANAPSIRVSRLTVNPALAPAPTILTKKRTARMVTPAEVTPKDNADLPVAARKGVKAVLPAVMGTPVAADRILAVMKA